jgi:hypothetical protein
MRCDSGTVIGNKVDTEHRNANVHVMYDSITVVLCLYLCKCF